MLDVMADRTNQSDEQLTTICLPTVDRDAVKAIATGRGLKIKYAPGVMAEAWKLLTDSQITEASDRYFRRLRKLSRSA